jgi:predicted DNA-binding transcriptional regulator AlpA
LAEFNDFFSDIEKHYATIDDILDSLSDSNKIFLAKLIDDEKHGYQFLYVVFDFLDDNVNDLQTLNGWLGGEVSDVFSKFDHGKDILQLIDLFNELNHFQIKNRNDIDTEKVVKKLKRTVYELKKKLEQPQIFINTKQFEERYGLSQAQQKGLRSKIRDALPHHIQNGKTILYKTEEIEKWMENYKKV